jgi:hypothetical protein
MGVHQTQQLGIYDFTLLQNIAPLLFKGGILPVWGKEQLTLE